MRTLAAITREKQIKSGSRSRELALIEAGIRRGAICMPKSCKPPRSCRPFAQGVSVRALETPRNRRPAAALPERPQAGPVRRNPHDPFRETTRMTAATLAAAPLPGRHGARPLSAGLLLGVLGVVYGDIGTSPLYAFKASLEHFAHAGIARAGSAGHPVADLLVAGADRHRQIRAAGHARRQPGRGRHPGADGAGPARSRRRRACGRRSALVGIVGACLFFGDGVITPAISVLSAVEGLEIAAPRARSSSCCRSRSAVIVGAVRGAVPRHRQRGPRVRPGDGASGSRVIGALGVARDRAAIRACCWRCRRSYAVALCLQYRLLAFLALGAVVLAVTGAEALYADMGHFGAQPIRAAWLVLRAALPGAELFRPGRAGAAPIRRRSANPFFLLAPDWLRLPLVVLATAATVIASQALISGAYSMARQCMQLGFLPRMTVRHTSPTEAGQIYVPQINIALLVGVLVLVFAFRTSDELAAAYGIAVTGTFICTALLAVVVFRRQFGWSRAAGDRGVRLLLRRRRRCSSPPTC